MKNFLNKYRVPIKVIAIIVWTILAIVKWIQFSETGNNMSVALVWSILALYYILTLVGMKRDKKLSDQVSLSDNSKDSSE